MMIQNRTKRMIRNYLENETHGLNRRSRRMSEDQEALELPSTESNDALINNCDCQDDDGDDEVLSLPGSTLTNRNRIKRKSKKVTNAFDDDFDDDDLGLPPSTQRQRSRD